MSATTTPADLQWEGSPATSIDRALRQLRLIVGAGVILQFVVTDQGGTLPRPETALLALGTAAAVAIVNYLSVLSGRTNQRSVRTLLDIAVLAADCAFTIVIVTQLDLLDPQVSWALLVVPVLEGALRFRLRGAVVVWAVITIVYVGLEISIPSSFNDPLTASTFLGLVQTLLYRAGIVLLVAVPGGFLSDQLVRAIDDQRRAQLEASKRSSLLVQVVDAGRTVGRLDADLHPEVAEAVLGLGFAASDWCHLDDRYGWMNSNVHRSDDTLRLPPASDLADVLDRATEEGRSYLVGPAEDDPEVAEMLADNGLGVMVICPVPGHHGTRSVLRASVPPGVTPPDSQIECLELIAGQMSVAFDNGELIGQLNIAHERLEHQAHHDALTGLANRLLFSKRLNDALTDVRASAGGRSLAILFIDLDRFKEVNDTLGHDVGDELLVAVAGRLTNAVRTNCTVARLGGDEFIVLLPDTDEGGAEAVARRVTDRLNRPLTLKGHSVGLSGSVGVVVTQGEHDGAELLRRGDVAMYQAKAQGRSTWQMYSPELDADNRSKNGLALALRRAIDQNALTADYQPVVGMSDGSVVGVEALVRWHHPEHGQIPPDQFIPVAEDSGLIEDVGRFMLEEACQRACDWRNRYPNFDLSMAVNISPNQARRDGFVDMVMSVLADHGLQPQNLVLELTERVLVEAEVQQVLAELRARHIRIAVDDFGAGHTSIGSLWRLPVDILKIDRSFVSGVGSNPQKHAILQSMIRLGHDLGLTVIAEGVETAEDLERLRVLGCDAVQGYHLHRPMEPDAISALLGRPNPINETLPTLPPASAPAISPAKTEPVS